MPDEQCIIDVHERIAVLESKVDTMIEELKFIGTTMHSLSALYTIAKWSTWVIGALIGFTHWPELISFIDDWLNPPRHH